MNQKRSLTFCLIISFAATGCGVVPPRVQYSEYTPNMDGQSANGDQLIFRLRRSVLLIKKSSTAFTFEASPYELTPDSKAFIKTYYMAGKDDLRSTTQLKITYLDSTKIPDTITVTTTDNLADTISKIGEVGQAIAPVAAAFVSGQQAVLPPTFNDTTLDPAEVADEAIVPDPRNDGICLRVSNRVTEPGVSAKDYIDAAKAGARHDFPTPACVSAQVEVLQCRTDGTAPTVLASAHTTFASDQIVVPMLLPSTGSLKMNTVCGANVTPADKEDRYQVLTYLQNLMKSVSSVQSAVKSAKK
ncbi:hypothetical protein [Caballeronia sp. ATUFL_M2_KS44]|uniref:hypothetical protein n=1 Tax=Caballeronia sp. ATUFL_M2_KS44 TaxID=2921767 RepID=UPI0020286F4F|nr:hypothetical protein [Caballeronia sp. ATUFL_M2_KS44]